MKKYRLINIIVSSIISSSLLLGCSFNKISNSISYDSSEIDISEELSSQELIYDDYFYFDAYRHWRKCITEGYEHLHKDEGYHTYVDRVNEGTFEKSGSIERVCSICGYVSSYTSTGTKEHTYSELWSRNSTSHWHRCIDSGYENLKIEESEHIKVFVEDIAPTERNSGLGHHECKICGYQFDSDIYIPATGSKDYLAFTFDKEKDGYVVSSRYGVDIIGEVVVPSIYEGYPVIAVAEDGFINASNMVSIELPSSIKEIRGSAFRDCSSLTNINIPSDVTNINEYVFYGCSSLESIELPSNITSIGDNAFIDCSSLTNINIPNTVNSIGESAFCWCSSLEEIYLPDGITSLGIGLFESCKSLKEVNIPDNVTSIGKSIFFSCEALEEFDIPNQITSIGDNAFYGCKSLISVTMSDNVTSIGSSAFSSCTSLEEVRLSNNITSIPNYLFSGDKALTTINIPDQVTDIGSGAFSNCSSLTNFVLPSSLTSIDYNSFSNTTFESFSYYGSLANWLNIAGKIGFCHPIHLYLDNSEIETTHIDIPDTCSEIFSYAFYNCTSITSIDIPNTVTTIYNSAFLGCVGIRELSIPFSITSIGKDAFKGCDSLETLSAPILGSLYDMSIPTSVKYINVCEGVTKLPKSAFYNRSNIEVVNLPSTLNSIGDSAFYKCASITNINIPEGVASIGSYAFEGCTGLTSLVMPDSVTSVGNCICSGCTNLESINFSRNLTPSTMGYYTLSGCKNIQTISTSVLGNKDDPLEWHFGGFYFGYKEVDWYSGVENRANYIGSYNPQGGSYTAKYYVAKTPDTLKEINVLRLVNSFDIKISNFRNMVYVEKVTFEDNVLSIPSKLFENCTKLKTVILPSSLESLGAYAFSNCTSLTEITLPASLTYLYSNCFSNTNLTYLGYDGSMSDWGNIHRYVSWSDGLSVGEVHCSDGVRLI